MFSSSYSSSKFTFSVVPFNKEIKDFLNVMNEWTLARQVYGAILNFFNIRVTKR